MLRACPSCGTKNRIPAARAADQGRCGACKAGLPPPHEPIDIGDEASFVELTQQQRVPVLIDFWAAWCGPCRAAAPHVKQVAHEFAGRALVLKVDTEKHGALAARFGVRGIPNFVVLRDGKPTHQEAGLVDAHTMGTWLRAAGA